MQRADEAFGPEWKESFPDGEKILFDTIRSLVVRFDETLVCSDCNAADWKAKKAASILLCIIFISIDVWLNEFQSVRCGKVPEQFSQSTEWLSAAFRATNPSSRI